MGPYRENIWTEEKIRRQKTGYWGASVFQSKAKKKKPHKGEKKLTKGKLNKH